MTHVCDCGDCAVAPFDDRCKYELALRRAWLVLEAVARIEIGSRVWTTEEVKRYQDIARTVLASA